MSFTSAVDHLHALGLELAPAGTAPRRKFDLEHMRILARALGDPQTQFPSVLIAGTNGKGSTAATLSSILAAAGFRTGLYTSPHLTRVTERIRISYPSLTSRHSGAQLQNLSIGSSQPRTFPEIPEPDFARLYFQVDEAANRLVAAGQLPHHPSFFETLTALAFLYFAEQKVDIAILEVGLGGRLDATNIVEPILSVITDIALDHQEYLGNTIAEIAREKAGILRAGGTLITLPQHPAANQSIGEIAVALNVHAINAADYLPGRKFAPPQFAVTNLAAPQHSVVSSTTPQNPVILSEARSAESKDPETSNPASAPSDLSANTATPLPQNHYTVTLDSQLLHVRSPLAGEHQQRNIALAIAAAVELRDHFSNKSAQATPKPHLEPRTSNLEPSLDSIERGIAQTYWPGRLEFLPPNLLLDVAHNPAGAWTLRAAIASLPQDQPRTLIFSCLRDKDLREMAQILFPLFDSSSTEAGNTRGARTVPHEVPSNLEPRTLNLVLTPIDSPRATSLDELIAAARALDIPAHPAETPAEALALARSLTPANGLILATGSVYLIGALRDLASN